MSKRELYVYSTKSHLKSGLVKVGHCLTGRHLKRIREQFGTSNPEPPIFKFIGPLPDGVTDDHIRDQLVKSGFPRVEKGPGKEWVHATFDDVIRAYNEIVFHSSRKNSYSPRKEQLAAIEKAKKWFLKEYSAEIINSATHPDRFLLNAKMRFGKCFTGVHLAKALKLKRTLIVTYKPDVINEWIDAVNDHVDFEGWIGIRAKKANSRITDPCLYDYPSFPKDSPFILCVSLQDLWISQEGETKARLQLIPQTKWDLVIFDEVHYGSRTKRAQHILNQLNYHWRLDLSGTPFKLTQEDDFCAQQVFTYSYLDEQKNKLAEIESDRDGLGEKIYRLMPDLDISTIEITEQDIGEQRETFQTDDIDFSLNRLFETKDGNFVYEAAVDHFIDRLVKVGHGASALSVFGALGQQLGCPTKRHSVWWLNRVDSIKALTTKLNKHPYFSSYIIIDASGSDKTQEGLEEKIVAREKSKVEKAIRKAKNAPITLGTITLTCGRFLTGVTIKEWDSILVLNDTKSPEAYFQALFRVQSIWLEEDDQGIKKILKPKAWVFDFAITRCLRLTYECALNLADQIDQQEAYEGVVDLNRDNLEIITRDLCESLDIKRFYEGSLISDPTAAKDIFDVLNLEGSRVSLARRITSNVLVNFTCLKLLQENQSLLEILKKIKGYRTQDVGSITAEPLVQIGIEASQIQEIKTDQNLTKENKEELLEDFVEKDKDKERRSYKKWYTTQIKRLAICMADFIYMTYEREYNIDHVIHTKSPQFFEVMTGITKDDFTLLCEIGFISRVQLNRIVREFRDQETTSLYPEEFIFENLRGYL